MLRAHLIEKVKEMAARIVEALNLLDDHPEEQHAARRALGTLVGKVTAIYGKTDTSIDILFMPFNDQGSASFRKTLSNAGVPLPPVLRTKEDPAIHLMQTSREAAELLVGATRAAAWPVVLRYRNSDLIGTVIGQRNVLRYLVDRGAINGIAEEEMSKSTQEPIQKERSPKNTVACALRTETGLTYDKKCCGGKIRKMPWVVCPYHRQVTPNHCNKCKQSIPVGEEIPPELKVKIEQAIAIARDVQ